MGNKLEMGLWEFKTRVYSSRVPSEIRDLALIAIYLNFKYCTRISHGTLHASV